MSDYTQHIPLDGAMNFRDFGGYKTQHGHSIIKDFFYRSAKLNTLTDNDQKTLANFNIGHIYDLRRPDEVSRAPTQWQATDVQIHHYSIIHPSMDARGLLEAFSALTSKPDPGVAMMEQLYRDIGSGEQSFPYFKQLFSRLIEDTHNPILVHCSGGKDRTGSTCALIQWVLGCDMDTIFADYMLSKPLYCDKVDPLHMAMQIAQIDNKHNIEDAWLTPIMEVRESYLNAMFEELFLAFKQPQDFLSEALQLPKDALLELRQQYTNIHDR